MTIKLIACCQSKQFSLIIIDWWNFVISGFVSTLPSCLKALPAFEVFLRPLRIS